MPLDRRSLVDRHNPTLTTFDPLSPLSVGNGEFAFTPDLTGLQTFPDAYATGIPLCTQSQWAWHTAPAPPNLPPLKPKLFDAHGRPVPYASDRTGQQETFDYLRQNPHRLQLGQIAFTLHTPDGRLANISDLTSPSQTLDLWTGTLHSQFSIANLRANVTTCARPTRDAIAVEIRGPLIEKGFASLTLRFPAPSPEITAADWDHPERHATMLVRSDARTTILSRQIDRDGYHVTVWFNGQFRQTAAHEFEILPARGASRLALTCEFTPTSPTASPIDFDSTLAASRDHWSHFWSTGGALDLSRSRDPRAKELERRCVLSQYLTAIQCAGSLPPQETGLTCNSWYGKFHLEMHPWHAAHFPLWSRPALLQRSMDYYLSILDSARDRARSQGYAGARWPKMTDPSGADSPSPIGPFLIWQQPHPILMLELLYRAAPNDDLLKRFASVVEESATFMASYCFFDDRSNRYVLGPPLIPAQENHPPTETQNPTFELSYWHTALTIAQQWRDRLHQPRNPDWDRVIAKLSPLPQKDGLYLAHENCPQTFADRNHDHPSMLCALGLLPGDKVDPETMRRTLDKVRSSWDWPSTWGWDYGVCALTATRLNRPDLALEFLLLDTPKNHYAKNGHNYQRASLPLYLPGNGSLLLALASMSAGFHSSGNNKGRPIGFPADGSWEVAAENILPLL